VKASICFTHANTIANNTVQGHGTAGIYIKGSNRNTIEGNIFTNDPVQLVSGSQQNVLRNNTIIGQRIKFDGASNNQVDNMHIHEQAGRPSSAYEFNQSSGNTIVDSEAIDPVDYHIRRRTTRRTTSSRASQQTLLRCFVDGKSSDCHQSRWESINVQKRAKATSRTATEEMRMKVESSGVARSR
jgi:parallel beta-helix repeat protein